jgi:hypothetical protein
MARRIGDDQQKDIDFAENGRIVKRRDRRQPDVINPKKSPNISPLCWRLALQVALRGFCFGR